MPKTRAIEEKVVKNQTKAVEQKQYFYGLETYSSDEEEEEEMETRIRSSTYQDIENGDAEVWEDTSLCPEDVSAIPEVAAVIPVRRDDVDLPVVTFRVLIISTLLCAFSAAASQTWYFRYNQAVMDSISHIILSYPIGIFFSHFGSTINWFNPGPFNYKEHALIVIICASTTSIPNQSSFLFIQRLLSGRDSSNIFSVLGYHSDIQINFMISVSFLFFTQLLGLSIGGILSKILVDPAQMWYPQNLVYNSLILSFHHRKSSKLALQRIKMLGIVIITGTLYQIIPTYFSPLLQSISILCLAFGGGTAFNFIDYLGQGGLMDPINLPSFSSEDRRSFFAQIASGNFGGGLFAISADYTAISKYSPLINPLWTSLNVILSNIFFSWILMPVMLHYNVLNASYFPAYGALAYTNQGALYNLTNIPQQPQPVLLSTNRILTLGCGIAGTIAIIFHFLVYYMFQTISLFRKQNVKKDVHTEIIESNYENIHPLIYVSLSLISTGFFIFIFSSHKPSFDLDYWIAIISIIIAIFFSIPIGIVSAISNYTISISDFNQLILGFIKPGSLLANSLFDALSSSTLFNILRFSAMLKFGYYMKISPKTVFIGLIWGAFISSFINYAVLNFLLQTVPAIWDAASGKFDSLLQWNSQLTRTAISTSLFWGVVSPTYVFGSSESIYNGLLWYFLLAGAILPVFFFFLHHLFPNFGFQYVNWPIIFQSISLLTTSGSNGLTSALFACIVTQHFFKKYKRQLYDKYMFIFAAGLDFAVLLAPLVVYAFKNVQLLPAGPFSYHIMNPDPDIYGVDYCGRI